jgi:hypothetical protein
MSWSAPPSSPAPPVVLTSSSKRTTKPATTGLDQKALLYMGLLALQFGMQPLLTRKFTPKGICGSSVILMQEVVKFGLAYFMLTVSGARKLAGTLGKSNNKSNSNEIFGERGMRRANVILVLHFRLDRLMLEFCPIPGFFILFYYRLEYTYLGDSCISSRGVVCFAKYMCLESLSKLGCINLQRLESNQDIISRSLLLLCHGMETKWITDM